MSDLRDRLARIGLVQYFEVFAAEGFDTWETVADITESDLHHLGVKIGHRRKLQRAIAELCRQSLDQFLPVALEGPPAVEGSSTSVKRKYQPHSESDEHAPQQPQSAHVVFTNQLRGLLKAQNLSSVEIANVFNKRWQDLSAKERNGYRWLVNLANETLDADVVGSTETPQFRAYHKQLEAKFAEVKKENKRSKVEVKASIATTRSSYCIQQEQTSNKSLDLVQLGIASTKNQGPSPPIATELLQAGSYSSKLTFSAKHPISSFVSPNKQGYSIPLFASPQLAAKEREASFETSSIHPGQDVGGPIDPKPPYTRLPSFATLVSYPYKVNCQPPVDLPSRLSRGESARLPLVEFENTEHVQTDKPVAV